MSEQLGDRILEALRRREPPAALVLEVASSLQPAPAPAQVNAALSQLADEGMVLSSAAHIQQGLETDWTFDAGPKRLSSARRRLTAALFGGR